MAKYLLMGDIHLSDRPPSSCTERYNDQIFEILEATVELARGCDGVIWAGDIFHHKTPGRTSHQTVRRAIEIAQHYPEQLWIVPGNHDLSNDRLASIDEGQPLGVLLASGAAMLLNGWHNIDPVLGVPWLGRFTDEAVTQALAPMKDRHARAAQFGTGINGVRFGKTLVVTHAPLYPPGLELPYEHYPASQWAAAMGNTGSVYYGHVHEAHGTYVTDGVTFCNPGAISRGSLHEHNLTRTPSCAIWDSDTGAFEIFALPAEPADRVFRLAEAEQTKHTQLRLDSFLDAVNATRIEITSTESVIAHIRAQGFDPDVERIVIAILEDVA